MKNNSQYHNEGINLTEEGRNIKIDRSLTILLDWDSPLHRHPTQCLRHLLLLATKTGSLSRRRKRPSSGALLRKLSIRQF